MIYTAVIEQTYKYENRMKYIASSNAYVRKEGISLSYLRDVRQPYGWLKESGTPPCPHLDVIIMTNKQYELGDEEKVRIIGVFCRNDGDHKLVGVLPERGIEDFSQLTDWEKADMHRLYPREDLGEGWFGHERAEEIIKEFMAEKKPKTLFLVQHTESLHHVNGMIGAWGDWELTDAGRAQAFEIGKKLLREGCGGEFAMYVSDLKRAVQTAEEINKTLGIKPVLTDKLREVNAGAGNGKTREWYERNKIPPKECYDPDYKPFWDGESDRELWNRLYPFYQEIISNHEDKIILVSHGTALSFLQNMLLGYSFRNLERIRFRGRSGCVSRLTVETDGKVIVDYMNQR